MNSDRIAAMMSGTQRGQAALQGVTPSAQTPGGAPPARMDYASTEFDLARNALSSLVRKLHQARDEHDANRVIKLLTQLTDITLERRKKMAQAVADQSTGQNSVLSSLAAQGIPRG